jgi:hypothetical protein
MRRRQRLVFGAVLCAALASTSGVATSAVNPAPRPVRQWTARICNGFARWQRQLTTLASSGAIGDVLHGSGAADTPDAIRMGVTQLLDGAVVASDRLSRDIQSAGVPKVKDGAAIATAYASSIQVLTLVFSAFRTRAQQLPPDQPGQQFRETQDLASLLQTAGSTLADTTSKAAAAHPTSRIEKAFASTKVCKPLL